MDIATGIMLTATALYQGVESPLGHVAFLEQSADNPEVAGMMDTIAENFEEFEDTERRSGRDDRDALYAAMRELAEKYDTEPPPPEEMQDGNMA